MEINNLMCLLVKAIEHKCQAHLFWTSIHKTFKWENDNTCSSKVKPNHRSCFPETPPPFPSQWYQIREGSKWILRFSGQVVNFQCFYEGFYCYLMLWKHDAAVFLVVLVRLFYAAVILPHEASVTSAKTSNFKNCYLTVVVFYKSLFLNQDFAEWTLKHIFSPLFTASG